MDVHIPKGLYFGVANFILFVLLLRYMLKVPLKDFFASRRVRLTKATAESERSLSEAERSFKIAEEKMSKASADTEALAARLKEEGAIEGRQVIERAREQAFRIKSELSLSADRDEKKMREKLSDEISRDVLSLASRKIKERMNAGVDKRIKENFIERMKGL